MSVYPEYKPKRPLFMPDPGKVPVFTVEIETNKGIKGYGTGEPGCGTIVMYHLAKLLVNKEDPFNIERIWDICWRSTVYYGRMCDNERYQRYRYGNLGYYRESNKTAHLMVQWIDGIAECLRDGIGL